MTSFDEFNYHGIHHSDATTSAETSSSSSNCITAQEVMLASERPKKRAGRKVFNETRHPVYRGVRRRNNNKWVCEMRVPNDNKSRIWLGTYSSPEMAARAHDVAALTLRGKSACLNFADSAWRLTLPESTDAVEIRRAAIEAAEMIAAEDYRQQQQQQEDVVHQQQEEQSNRERMVIEDDGNNSKGMSQNSPAVSSEFEEWRDVLLSIADEPLRSPPPSTRDYSNDNWRDVDIFETQVQLWNFSI